MKNIATAFIKAKKAFSPALKTATNPHFKSRYADLSACVEAVDDAFLSAGIVMYQETFESDDGVTVETVLLHESGEMIRCGKLHMPASKNDAQGFMSALTYCRRGSLMSACGIAPEDDDGNAAVKSAAKSAPAKKAAPAIVWDLELATSQIMVAKTEADLTKVYQGWLEPATKAGQKTELITLCKARKQDILDGVQA
jgi:hypothetical protein